MPLIHALQAFRPWFAWAPPWVFTLVLVLLALVVARVAHGLLLWLGRRALDGQKAEFLRPLMERTRGATWLALTVVLLSIAIAASPLKGRPEAIVQHGLGIGFVVLFGWASMISTDVASALYLRRYRVDVDDNLLARKHLTQIRILQRAAVVVIGILTAALALTTINQVRQWGVSLLAAGGAATVIVGLALQPLLTNLIAGIQIALTQPIRIDDQLLVESEFGWVEEITSTYVVVRIWDERRMVLPLTYFLQKPFQNWTRETSRLLGAVMLYVDYSTPVEALRSKLTELLKADPRWDGRVNGVQVTDCKDATVEIRCLVSASNPGKLFDLRCAVREGLITYLREAFPASLPRNRLEFSAGPGWNGAEPSPVGRPQ